MHRIRPCDNCSCKDIIQSRQLITEEGITSEQYQERCANVKCNALLYGYIKPIRRD